MARIPMANYPPSPVWYDEKMGSVTEKQMELMNSHGLDFVVFDSFWGYVPTSDVYVPYWSHVLENLKQPGFNFHGMEFAIMWANDFTQMVHQAGCERYLRGGSGGGLDAMITYWSQYINHPSYKHIDGKPVFYIFYPSTRPENFGGVNTTPTIEGLCGYCAADPFFAPLGGAANEPFINNNKTKFLLEQIEQKLGKELYFVAVLTPDIRLSTEPPADDWTLKHVWLVDHPELAGYDAVTSYGYKYFDYEDAFVSNFTTLCNGTVSNLNWNYDYAKMQSVYSEFYDYIINNSTVNYQVPVSAGWNRGPLNMFEKHNGMPLTYADACNNYSRDPLDQAFSTPGSFEQSLIMAKNLADAHPGKTNKTIMISAWNEYAEGTVVEPTYNWGTQYLEKIKSVFM